jgi:hypothetical protein
MCARMSVCMSVCVYVCNHAYRQHACICRLCICVCTYACIQSSYVCMYTLCMYHTYTHRPVHRSNQAPSNLQFSIKIHDSIHSRARAHTHTHTHTNFNLRVRTLNFPEFSTRSSSSIITTLTTKRTSFALRICFNQ